MPDLVVAPPMSQTRQILQLMEGMLARGITPERAAQLAVATPAELAWHQCLGEFVNTCIGILRANVDPDVFPMMQMIPAFFNVATGFLVMVAAGCAADFEDQSLVADLVEIATKFLAGDMDAVVMRYQQAMPKVITFAQRVRALPVSENVLPMWGDESSDDEYHVDPNA